MKVFISSVTMGRYSGGATTITRSFSLSKLEAILAKEYKNEWERDGDIEELCVELHELFYNSGMCLDNLKKLVRSLKRRKTPLIESWEEGVTGVSTDKAMTKASLVKAVRRAFNDACGGESFADDIKKLCN